MKLHRKAANGFTLVELLLAAAITILIVVMLGTMFGSLTGITSRATQRIDAFREARAALQLIERDLSSLVHIPSSAYLLLTDRTYSDPSTTKAAQIFALCAAKNKPFGSSAAPGDVCAIGYYSRWDTDANGKRGHYTLHRYFRDSVATFNFFKSAGAGNYVSPVTLYAPGTVDEPLASYVWNMQVVAYRSDGTVDSTFPMEVGASGVSQPAAIEVSFNVMSPSAARTIMSVSSNATDWMDASTQNYKRLIAPNVYQFRTRLNLP